MATLPAYGTPAYALTRALPGRDFAATIEATKAALAESGFGVLTTIDVQATLKKKLDEDLPGYMILGACAPKFAFHALSMEPGIGVLLPCNVVVTEEPGQIVVSAIDPRAMFSVVTNADVAPVADQVRGLLQAALDRL